MASNKIHEKLLWSEIKCTQSIVSLFVYYVRVMDYAILALLNDTGTVTNRIRINQHTFANNTPTSCINPCRSLADDERIEDANECDETRMNLNSNLHAAIKFNHFMPMLLLLKKYRKSSMSIMQRIKS